LECRRPWGELARKHLGGRGVPIKGAKWRRKWKVWTPGPVLTGRIERIRKNGKQLSLAGLVGLGIARGTEYGGVGLVKVWD